MKTGAELALFAISTVGAPYMYGVNGQIITQALIDEKIEQYPAQYTPEKVAHLRKQRGKIAYQCNSYLSMYLDRERSANGWRSAGTGGSIETIPEQPGISVHYNGHMGIYIGNGQVVEARGTFYGVVITALNARPWQVWRKQPEINYSDQGVTPMILQKGMKDSAKGGYAGTAVSEWQETLTQKGIKMINDSGKQYGVDGEFGSATENGTKEFQKQSGLTPTGAVDYPTFAYILADARTVKTPAQPDRSADYDKLVTAIKTISEVI